jgi:predicted nuclease with TOPRIM domain
MSNKMLLLKISELNEEKNELTNKYNNLKYKYKELKNKCYKLETYEKQRFENFLKEYPHITKAFPKQR